MAPADHRPGKGKVLVVEDDYLIAMFVQNALRDSGHEVAGVAATAADAVALAMSVAPDLVVMDVRLIGERDGIDAALELRSRGGPRCIFATAHYDESTRRRAAMAAPLGWLPKPYEAEALIEEVERALGQLREGRP